MNDSRQAGFREVEGYTLIDFLRFLGRRKALIFGMPLLLAVLAGLSTYLIPKSYTATSRILPPQQSNSAVAAITSQLAPLTGLLGTVAPGFKNANEMYVGMLKSRTVADAITARFQLKDVYDEETIEDTRKELEEKTQIAFGRDGLITISFEDTDPRRAADVANAYVEELDRLTQSLAVTEASQRRLFFEKQLQSVRSSLADAEIALQTTQETTGVIKLDDQGRALIEAFARLKAEIAAKEVQIGVMSRFATKENPEFIRAQEQLTGLKAQLSRLVNSTGSTNGDIMVPTGKVPEIGLHYVRRVRELRYQEAMFEALSKQYELARIDEAKDSAVIQFVDRAVSPEKKSKPRRLAIALVAGGITLLLAFVAALILEAFDRAKSNPDTAKAAAELLDLWKVK